MVLFPDQWFEEFGRTERCHTGTDLRNSVSTRIEPLRYSTRGFNSVNTRELLPSLFEDDDTYKILDIAGDFLFQYFDHSAALAAELTISFFKHHGDRFTEDIMHHDSSFRIAAAIHYFEFLNRSTGGFGDWLIASGNIQTPDAALAYFRERYFGP